MNIPKIEPAALALALGLAFAGIAGAQDAPTPAQQKELDAARAELDKAAQHFAELHRKYGGADAPFRIEKRMLRKPVIGVLLSPDEAAGVRIAGVTPDSAAAAGGLKSGDRIVGIDGKILKSADGVARVEEARELLGAADTKTPVMLNFERDGKARVVSLTPKIGDRLLVVPDGAMFDGNVQVFTGDNGEIEVLSDRVRVDATTARDQARVTAAQAREIAAQAKRQAEWAVAVAPDLRRDIIRLRSDCKGDDCKLPALAEAFRWNGLNLASVEGGLGRYFGSDQGVLVLSTGKDLAGLEAGDVILKIAGKPVNNPREAMDALRAQPADSKVGVEYLRDRKPGNAQVSMPKALPFKMRAPPVPPTPPAPPAPRAGMAPPPPPAAPVAPQVVTKRKVVIVDQDGKTRSWEGGPDDTPPSWAPEAPPTPPAPPAPAVPPVGED